MLLIRTSEIETGIYISSDCEFVWPHYEFLLVFHRVLYVVTITKINSVSTSQGWIQHFKYGDWFIAIIKEGHKGSLPRTNTTLARLNVPSD